MTETPQRPWWKLHALTWATLLLVCVSILALNLEWRGNDARKEYWQSHGWPFLCLWHESIDTAVGLPPFDFSLLFAPQNIRAFRLRSVAANAMVWLALVTGTAFSVEKCQRRHPIPFAMSIGALLAILGVFASEIYFNLAFLHESYADYGFPVDADLVATTLASDAEAIFRTIAYTAVFLAWLAFFDLVGLAWNRLSRRRA